MNKWIERAIFINLIFIMIYIFFDYGMWMGIPSDMVGISHSVGTFDTLRVFTNYDLFIRIITVAGNYRYSNTFESEAYVSQLPNLPLIIFLAMILTNILLLRKAIRKPV